MDNYYQKSKQAMKRVFILASIFTSLLLLTACSYSKWEHPEDLIGVWVPRNGDSAKIVFNDNGTCYVDVPTDIDQGDWGIGSPFAWDGNTAFDSYYSKMERWTFFGYWKIKETKKRVTFLKFSTIWYSYKIRISPYRELLGSDEESIFFMNNSDAMDVYWIEIGAWTESLFPPARLKYLYHYSVDPDWSYDFCKEGKRRLKLANIID